jgi:hypothetical protein
LQIKTKIVSCNTADSKPVKQEVNGTVILPPLVFPDQIIHVFLYLIIFDILKPISIDAKTLKMIDFVDLDEVAILCQE